MKIAVIIPSRLQSTRLPHKPLMIIGDKTLLSHVVDRAQSALVGYSDIDLYVATDDDAIHHHAKELGIQAIMTDAQLPSGTDRVHAAATLLGYQENDIIINLQGDAPLIPIDAIRGIIDIMSDANVAFVTAVQQLSWEKLDSLREHKKTTPTSGTTTIIINDHAVWFSKEIIPHTRNTDRSEKFSPVYRHYGIYGYTYGFLNTFVRSTVGQYEHIEGLEQLRAIEKMHIYPKVYRIDPHNNDPYISIDTLADKEKYETLLKEHHA